jgi:hypothetical protein
VALNLFGFLQRRRTNATGQLIYGDDARIAEYARFMRAYRGYSVKGPLSTGTADSWKRIKFNFSRPIVNLGAGWMAARPIKWCVDDDPAATDAAHAIWDRSGSDGALLANALLGCIYGDVVALATQDPAGKPKIEFVDPSICFPTFDGADYGELTELEVCYERVTRAGERILHREFYGPQALEVYENDQPLSTVPYETLPVVWIRNQELKGYPFGLSDLESVVDLVEEYDHIAGKWTRVLDYVAQPRPWFKGVQKGDLDLSVGRAIFLPKDGEAGFMEYKGHTPDVEAQLTRIRNAIAEISQVPAVAFGQADSGLTSLSGVALEILYGPLIEKTRRRQASWGACLERVMWLALAAAGFAVDLEDVNVEWPEARPVDGQAQIAEACDLVAAKLVSRRTAMAQLGTESPEDELKKMTTEDKIFQLAGPPPDPIAVARAANKGRAATEQPGPTSTSLPAPQGPAAAAFGALDPGASIDELLRTFDALIAAENDNLDAQDEGA